MPVLLAYACCIRLPVTRLVCTPHTRYRCPVWFNACIVARFYWTTVSRGLRTTTPPRGLPLPPVPSSLHDRFYPFQHRYGCVVLRTTTVARSDSPDYGEDAPAHYRYPAPAYRFVDTPHGTGYDPTVRTLYTLDYVYTIPVTRWLRYILPDCGTPVCCCHPSRRLPVQYSVGDLRCGALPPFYACGVAQARYPFVPRTVGGCGLPLLYPFYAPVLVRFRRWVHYSFWSGPAFQRFCLLFVVTC